MAAKWKCTWCGDFFYKAGMLVTPRGKFCTPEHALEYARQPQQKSRAYDAMTREMKSMHLPTQLESTKKRVHEFILVLDDRLGCASCHKTTGTFHAGHFKTQAGNSHIRFDPRNIHKQCAGCNLSSERRKASQETITADYRATLVDRYGQPLVDWLEGPHPEVKYNVHWLAEVRKLVQAETKLLKSGHPPTRDWRDPHAVILPPLDF